MDSNYFVFKNYLKQLAGVLTLGYIRNKNYAKSKHKLSCRPAEIH